MRSSSDDLDDDVWVESIHPMNDDEPSSVTPSERDMPGTKRNWKLKCDLQPRVLFPDSERHDHGKGKQESESDHEGNLEEGKTKGTYKDLILSIIVCI